MYIADFHIHSRYSYATSKTCTLEYLDLWARRKGIHIVGTGDFTHPAWRAELKEKLAPAEDGLYILKEEYRLYDEADGKKIDAYGRGQKEMIPRFIISGEISSVYKKEGRSRKVHSLLLLPDFEAAERIADRLSQIGNICSDGRPTLRLDCRDLLELALDECGNSIYIPAHIWTPHFSVFGEFSGFETPDECFGDMTSYVYAMETGLSSDPLMNRRVSVLDDYRLISNSDAHSPGNLGREATLFDVELSYRGIAEAIRTGNGLCGTIEFFPQEGKYHLDGHRKCGVCFTPEETKKFMLASTFGVPMKSMKQFLNLPQDRQDAVLKNEGIPTDSIDNQFKAWVRNARATNSDLRIAIKADANTPYSVIKNVMNSLQDLRENRYNLITSLKTTSED